MKHHLIAATFIAATAPVAAMADPSPEEIIVSCRNETATGATRIDCLENAIRMMGRPSPQPQSETDEETASIQTDPSPATQALSENTPEASPPAVEGIGAEQVVSRREKSTKEGRKERKVRESAMTVESRLLDFAYTGAGRLVLVLDNGQVWVQRAGDNQKVRLRDGARPDIKIRRGALSGYRLEFSNPDMTIIVERLQ